MIDDSYSHIVCNNCGKELEIPDVDLMEQEGFALEDHGWEEYDENVHWCDECTSCAPNDHPVVTV